MSYLRKKSITEKLRLSKILENSEFVLFLNVDVINHDLIVKLRCLNVKFHICPNHVIKKVLNSKNQNIDFSIKGSVVLIYSNVLKSLPILKKAAIGNLLFLFTKKRFIPLFDKNLHNFYNFENKDSGTMIQSLFYLRWLELIKTIKPE